MKNVYAFIVCLFMVGLLCAPVTLAADAVGGGGMPSSVTDQAFPLTLCVDGNTVYVAAIPLGNAGGMELFGINGWHAYSKNILVDGTAIYDPVEATVQWGLQLENAMSGYAAVVWEFVTDLNFNGAGEYQWQTNGEPYGTLTVSGGACTGSEAADMKAIGR